MVMPRGPIEEYVLKITCPDSKLLHVSMIASLYVCTYIYVPVLYTSVVPYNTQPLCGRLYHRLTIDRLHSLECLIVWCVII